VQHQKCPQVRYAYFVHTVTPQMWVVAEYP
jgi:hypothetical protein